jgi:hypothetical protein
MAAKTDNTLIPAGHIGFTVGADEKDVPMTDSLGLVENSDGQIISRLMIIWPAGVARERAELVLRDMYATAMLEIDKRETDIRKARLS